MKGEGDPTEFACTMQLCSTALSCGVSVLTWSCDLLKAWPKTSSSSAQQ